MSAKTSGGRRSRLSQSGRPYRLHAFQAEFIRYLMVIAHFFKRLIEVVPLALTSRGERQPGKGTRQGSLDDSIKQFKERILAVSKRLIDLLRKLPEWRKI